MAHTEQTVKELLPEPDNGTRLVVQNDPTDYKVIWRDDEEAARWRGDYATERWFCEGCEHPMDLHQHVKYAQAVYPFPGEPLVHFGS